MNTNLAAKLAQIDRVILECEALGFSSTVEAMHRIKTEILNTAPKSTDAIKVML